MCILGGKSKDIWQNSVFSTLHSVNKERIQYNLYLKFQHFGTLIFCQFYSYAKSLQLKSCLQYVDSLETRKDFRFLATFDPGIILHMSIASKIVSFFSFMRFSFCTAILKEIAF